MTKHVAATCPQCIRLARGETRIKAGNMQIPPFCALCDGHHFRDYHRLDVREGEAKSLCPKCRRNRCEVEHIQHAFRADRTHYADGCRSCLEDEGYVYYQATDEIGWWEKPLPVADTMPLDDIFAACQVDTDRNAKAAVRAARGVR